jgi:hypothetical protein
MLSIVYLGDKRPISTICTTDYVNTLYAGGHMVNHGAGRDLYPDLSATSFYGEKFATYTTTLLPPSQKIWLYLFTYPPIIAMVAAPFTYLDPVSSLVAWQVFSFAGLVLSAVLFAKTDGVRASPLQIVLVSCLFFPLLNVIVIGQTSILLGILPLSAGYFFWQRNKPFLTGLCWSVLGLKPQLALPIVIICASLIIAHIFFKDDKTERHTLVLLFASLLSGTAILHLIPIIAFGADSLFRWLHAVKMSSQAFGAQETGYWQYHLFFSLPCLVILLLPQSWWLAAKTPAYILGVVMLVLGMFVACKLLRMKLSTSRRIDFLIILTIPFVIAASPHLLLYDTCLLLLPAWILFFKLTEHSALMQLAKLGALFFLFLFDLYICLILSPSPLPVRFFQVLIVFGIPIYTLLVLMRLPKNEVTT